MDYRGYIYLYPGQCEKLTGIGIIQVMLQWCCRVLDLLIRTNTIGLIDSDYQGEIILFLE